MRVVILGAGGVGGYLGARLITGGADVAFLTRGARAAELSARGLVVKSPLGDFAAPVKVMVTGTAPETAPDVVVLACKELALASALDAVTPLLGNKTRLLPLLNGVRHLDLLSERYADTHLLGGIIHGATNLRSDGVIEHLSSFMTVITGPVATASDPVADEFVDRLKRAGVEAHVTHEIRQDMWNKFVFLAAFAGITCLMRASIGAILQTDHGRARILHLLDETRSVPQAEGHAPPEAMMEEYRALLTQDGSALTSSMLRDIESGRRTEGAHILGDMLQRPRKHELPAPVLAIAAAHVQAYEKRLNSSAV
jgi:2-dehydropantoate 2-reductase